MSDIQLNTLRTKILEVMYKHNRETKQLWPHRLSKAEYLAHDYLTRKGRLSIDIMIERMENGVWFYINFTPIVRAKPARYQSVGLSLFDPFFAPRFAHFQKSKN